VAEYNKSAIIKYTRLAKNMTQEELSQFICEPATLSRYENGQINPTNDKFTQLMQRMGETGELYTFPVQCETVDLQEKMKKLLYAIERKDWNIAEEMLENIKNEHCMSMEYPENRQYAGRIEIIIKFRRGEISIENALEEWEKLLKLTVKDYEKLLNSEFMRISENEMMILYNIASYSGDIGEVEKADFIFRNIRRYFQGKYVICDDRPRYLINTNYSNLLGLNGRYDESIQICLEEIRWLIKKNKANCLFNLYFNIGWNIVKKIEKSLEPKEKMEQAKYYVWLAYQLAKFYPEYDKYSKDILEFYHGISSLK